MEEELKQGYFEQEKFLYSYYENNGQYLLNFFFGKIYFLKIYLSFLKTFRETVLLWKKYFYGRSISLRYAME